MIRTILKRMDKAGTRFVLYRRVWLLDTIRLTPVDDSEVTTTILTTILMIDR